MCERQQLLRQVQMQDFALIDVSLYLDSHPNCQNALAYYQQHKALRDQAVAAYTSKYGPLTHADVCGTNCWSWVNNPWPWELEA